MFYVLAQYCLEIWDPNGTLELEATKSFYATPRDQARPDATGLATGLANRLDRAVTHPAWPPGLPRFKKGRVPSHSHPGILVLIIIALYLNAQLLSIRLSTC